MLSLPSGSEKDPEGLSDNNPIELQGVRSIDFERLVWMFYNELVVFLRLGPCCCQLQLIKYTYIYRTFSEYTASEEEWSSIIYLAYMWDFRNVCRAAFKAYVALPDVKPIIKIAMREKYKFPREYLLDAYLSICDRKNPLSVEEGKLIGLETLALITQTREVNLTWRLVHRVNRLRDIVNHVLIEVKPVSLLVR
jgi:hypothetical protein